MVDKHHALAREEIIEALTAWTGQTTADGAAPANNTLIDSNLIGKNDFITGKTILIGAGFDAAFEDRGAQSFNSVTGEITFTSGFSAQIKQGTIYRVLNFSSDALAIQTALGRKYTFLDFWSASEDNLTVTDVPSDITFPNIVVSELPDGLTIRRVVLILTCRAINDTSGAANYINGASKTLRVKKSTGAWLGGSIVGITFANQSLYCVASAKETGPVIIGDADIKSIVDGNATYNVSSEETNNGDAIVAAGANLDLYDVQVGLRVYYS